MSPFSQIPDADAVGVGPLSIAVISPDERRRSVAMKALSECPGNQIQEFVSCPSDPDDVPRMLGHNFDVVIVDLDTNPEGMLNLVEAISIHGLATAMVYSASIDPQVLLRCMRAGAREFFNLPFTPGAMSEALARASSIRSTDRTPTKTDGKLIAFISAKGGLGVTTLACNCAVALAQESEKKTLLIDLNLPLGDAAIDLGIKARYSTLNALENFSRLDTSFLSTMLVKHSSELFVLAAPSELVTVQVSDNAINKLLEVATQDFDYVVVDAGSRIELQHTHLFDDSTYIYLVTQVGIPALRNSNRLIAKLFAAGNPRLSIVINRYDHGNQGIKDEDIEKALTRPADWKIPNNYAAVRQMQNSAVPLTEEDTEIARAIRQMARDMGGLPAIPKKRKGFGFFR
jgi:pilus assembly protein CpaE